MDDGETSKRRELRRVGTVVLSYHNGRRLLRPAIGRAEVEALGLAAPDRGPLTWPAVQRRFAALNKAGRARGRPRG